MKKVTVWIARITIAGSNLNPIVKGTPDEVFVVLEKAIKGWHTIPTPEQIVRKLRKDVKEIAEGVVQAKHHQHGYSIDFDMDYYNVEYEDDMVKSANGSRKKNVIKP